MSQATSNGRASTAGIVLVILAVAALAIGGWYMMRSKPDGGGGGAPVTAAPQSIAPPRAPGVVYQADLDGTGSEWSAWQVSQTPDHQRQFIGPFLDEPLDLNIDRLPPHKYMRVRFELITYTRWNGDNAYFGRDSWDMRVADGQPLIHTTFSNCGFFSDNNTQSFPDQFPWYPQHKGWTGASAKQSLGWTSDLGRGQAAGCDSTYAFDLTFPHEGSVLTLEFISDIARHEKKPYGFLSFKVETVDQAAPADDAVLKPLWDALADEDAVAANQAVWSMVATGGAATDYIRKQLAAEMADRATAAMLRPGFDWAAAMDYSSKPAKRVTIPQTPGPAVLNVDPAKTWIANSIAYNTPEQRQRARAVHVLEAIGSTAAKEELKLLGYSGTPQEFPPDTSAFSLFHPTVN